MKIDMTDNEIIKAFEICYCDGDEGCGNCPCRDENGFCKNVGDSDILKDILNLINRQQTEIERLQDKYKRLEAASLIFKGGVDYFVKKAIKEFAKRLKELYTGEGITDDMHCSIGVIKANIDSLVEEMEISK